MTHTNLDGKSSLKHEVNSRKSKFGHINVYPNERKQTLITLQGV